MFFDQPLNSLGLGLCTAGLLLLGAGTWRYNTFRKYPQDQHRHQRLLNDLPGIVLQIEAVSPWRVILASQRAAELLGSGLSTIVGRPLLETALAPDDEDGIRELSHMLQNLRPGSEGAEVTYRYRQRDGSLHWFECNVRSGVDRGHGASPKMYVLLQDVTERQRAQQGLVVAQSIIQGSRDAIVSQTLQGVVTSWNSGATEIFGYSAEEAIGMPITKLFQKQDLHQETDIMTKIRQGLNIPPFDAVRVRRDGRQVHVSVSLSPILDDRGQVVGASKIARDVSERKLNEALRRDVANAEQMAATRTAFLARMSHELRTPMTAVLGFGGILLQSDLNEEQRSQVMAIQTSSRHLLALLDDVLDTARLDKGELVLNHEPFGLPELLSDIHAQFSPKAEAKHILFEVGCVKGTPELLEGDVQRVRQILVNLVDNAVKFTQAGKIQVIASYEDGSLLLDIVDTGLGISTEQLNQIFEPFVQVDASLGRKFGGAGLGTTLCKQLAQLMGGDINAYSTPGTGSHFMVRLPLPIASMAAQSVFADLMPLHPPVPESVPTETHRAPLALVDEQAGTAIWGNMRDVWLDSLRQFNVELPSHLDRIHAAFRQTDSKPALEAVHALRGGASAVALPALFDRLDTMETLLRADGFLDAQRHLGALADEATATHKHIALLTKLSVMDKPVPTSAEMNTSEALQQLSIMREQLERSEVPSRALRKLQRAFAGHQPMPQWQELCSALDAFEYELAQSALSALEAWVQRLPTAKE